jgi:hypothetical protein
VPFTPLTSSPYTRCLSRSLSRVPSRKPGVMARIDGPGPENVSCISSATGTASAHCETRKNAASVSSIETSLHMPSFDQLKPRRRPAARTCWRRALAKPVAPLVDSFSNFKACYSTLVKRSPVDPDAKRVRSANQSFGSRASKVFNSVWQPFHRSQQVTSAAMYVQTPPPAQSTR